MAYQKYLTLAIPGSQSRKLDELKINTRKNFGLEFPKSTIVKIAINELFEKLENENEINNILEKYGKI